MRPDRAIVQQAIRDSGGNLTRAAAILGCSRPTLYTWIYQLGLEKLAGIRLDTRDALDRRERKDTSADNRQKSAVKSGGETGRNLYVVAQQATVETMIPATVKLPESLWKRVARSVWCSRMARQFARRRS